MHYFLNNYSNNVIINDLLYYIILIILISVSPTIILGELPPAPLLKVKLILLNLYYLYITRSQKKLFNVTSPIEQVYTLLFY